jgi:hypothetical protein
VAKELISTSARADHSKCRLPRGDQTSKQQGEQRYTHGTVCTPVDSRMSRENVLEQTNKPQTSMKRVTKRIRKSGGAIDAKSWLALLRMAHFYTIIESMPREQHCCVRKHAPNAPAMFKQPGLKRKCSPCARKSSNVRIQVVGQRQMAERRPWWRTNSHSMRSLKPHKERVRQAVPALEQDVMYVLLAW